MALEIITLKRKPAKQKRTDVIVDYRGEQYIIEMKIWHGQEYNTRGEKQLAEYLDAYHVNQGYMISFNFNQKKEIGVHEILIDDKKLLKQWYKKYRKTNLFRFCDYFFATNR